MSLIDKVKNLFGLASTEEQPIASTSRPGEPVSVAPTSTTTGPPPAAQVREQVMRFIIGKLRAYQNEPDTAPAGIQLSVLCTTPADEELYRVVLWTNQPGKFEAELSRQLADNYITLPKNWQFAYTFFTDTLPDTTYREGNLGLVVVDRSKPDNAPLHARVTALVGQLEQPEYILDSAKKTTFCIGRGRTTQTASGRVRTNDIVILNEEDPSYDSAKGAGNGAVSRAHATIRFDPAQKRYVLLVDPGGLPAGGNKTKLIHPDDSIERADIAGMGYPLQNGDQIELGGEVTLFFELL
ncbi:FHA domain-containing protein [Spirosoma sp. RP8]|uniref:FHA domain-containing protein n=1 Tax=Spirosoma liriopis TaxID=2937440 RepID=A0ABT0HVC6_9BACT|nr:FHA domain-containing protein [Spirosoma liriopis]MCK8495787.1 FHA domain-containing protein [Spirosoma liriopis]